MTKIDITRTELVWPGKYNEEGTRKEVPRVSMPFQVIETVNESRATREAKKQPQQSTLFDVYDGKEGDTFEAGWRNKLIWGDNLLAMGSLLEKFEGTIDLIYIDPPFATGADFSVSTQIGDCDLDVTKEQSIIEEKAYRDTWGRGVDSYLEMIRERLILSRELLSSKGSLYVHCDWRMNSLLRLVLDEVFGPENFLNEITWRRSTPTGGKTKSKMFPRDCDNILFYSKSGTQIFNATYVPYSQDYIDKFFHYKDPDGRRWMSQTLGDYSEQSIKAFELQGRIFVTKNGSKRLKYYLDEAKGLLVDDFWGDIRNVRQQAVKNMHESEQWDYPTQKPEGLIHRIIESSSGPGDLVADFFSGSGTTAAVAESLGRRWMCCDLSRFAVHVSRKRMLNIDGCRPFEVLNLGKYERQYWQGVTFGEAKDNLLAEQALYEYLAFILKLYGAQPVAGMAQLHGKKGRAMVHIGAVDAPVTISEIDAAVDECAKLKQGELHVLGWEWEMGLTGPNERQGKGSLMHEAARKKGVKLILLIIPREVMEQQAAAKGDVRFFELAYLEAEIKQPERLTAQVVLKDFVIPNTELIPEEVRSKVKKWSDYIDYWSVDWDFQNDTFMQGWVAYRTPKERKLPLACDAHTYEKPGKYRILVKVIDIFGNDTSQAFDVEVK